MKNSKRLYLYLVVALYMTGDVVRAYVAIPGQVVRLSWLMVQRKHAGRTRV